MSRRTCQGRPSLVIGSLGDAITDAHDSFMVTGYFRFFRGSFPKSQNVALSTSTPGLSASP